MQADQYQLVHAICVEQWNFGLEDWDPAVSPFGDNPLAAHHFSVLLGKFHRGNQGPLRIEKALRHMSGFVWDNTLGFLREPKALPCITPILERTLVFTVPPNRDNLEQELKDEAVAVQAHSIAAYIYYRQYMDGLGRFRVRVRESRAKYPKKPEQVDASDLIKSIETAARHATRAAAMKFVTPAVLLAGWAFSTLLSDHRLALKDYVKYRPLWRALEATRGSFPNSGLPAHRWNPNICAHPECEARVSRGGLANVPDIICANCPPRDRPAYCSEECRDEDWMKHQWLCIKPHTLTVPHDVAFYGPPLFCRRLLESLVWHKGPVEFLEVLSEDESMNDPQNGTVLWGETVPCPLGSPNKRSRVVLKRYEA